MDKKNSSKVHSFAVGPSTHKIVCPHCGDSVQTKVNYKPTLWTYIVSLLLCPILCCCLPCCCGCFIHIQQICPNCKTYLGTYKKNLLQSND